MEENIYIEREGKGDNKSDVFDSTLHDSILDSSLLDIHRVVQFTPEEGWDTN